MSEPIEFSACPCGSGHPLVQCCGPILDGAPPPTAETLMRSRYTAHVLGRIDYILETRHPSKRSDAERAAVERWVRESTWLGLAIVARARGGAGDDDGIVEFEAAYRTRAGARIVHQERSLFRRLDGRWLYVDGDVVNNAPFKRAETPGRNDPCSCGSGKKYKRCCGA
ncbi:MAG: YchJ family protein [Myxococcales bacterium]|nr:YchJ family protein [Myxococcales bacterium]